MEDSHGNVLPETIQPTARWTHDCQGKQDFDGQIVSISTRYYPGPGAGGTMLIRDGQISILPYGPRPSAHSSINILFGAVDANGYNSDYFMLTEKTFEGDTEADVKEEVERWARDRANEVKCALIALYRR